MKQKEIWLINSDPTIGAEIRKTRPCVLLNDDSIGALPLKVVAPITDDKEKYKIVPWMIQLIPDKLNNLEKVSAIDVFQVRSVSEKRLIKKVDIIREDDLSKVKEALQLVFGL